VNVWIELLVEDRYIWPALLNVVIDLLSSIKGEKFLGQMNNNKLLSKDFFMKLGQ
jgi:hypothetical protein